MKNEKLATFYFYKYLNDLFCEIWLYSENTVPFEALDA
jgi:hypothetical protein